MATGVADSSKSAPRLKFVDGLRGIAAMMVVIQHLAPHGAFYWLTGLGYLGVGIFFVLSGFVITSVIADARVTTGYFARFVLRRCVRLDLPYWLSIPLAISLGAIVVYFGVPERHYSVAQIVAHVFYLQEILGFKEINDVYWTLCFEIQFYLSILLVIWAAQKARQDVRRLAFQAVVLASVAISLLFSAGVFLPPRGFMFGYWWAFALGAVTWWTVTGRASWPIFALVFAMTACLPLSPHEDYRITGLLTAAALLAAALTRNMDRWLADPVTQFLGRISYSLYLFHPLTGAEAQKLAERYTGPWQAFAIGTTVSILTAWIAYRLIERPAILLSRRVKLLVHPAPLSPASALGLGARNLTAVRTNSSQQ